MRIGLAGPTSLTTLMRYAKRCGVRASTQGLARNAGLIKHLLGAAAPDAIIRALIEANRDGELGDIAPHLFSFGGIGATARWAAAAAGGSGSIGRVCGQLPLAGCRASEREGLSSRPGAADNSPRIAGLGVMIPAILRASPVTSRMCSPVLARSTT